MFWYVRTPTDITAYQDEELSAFDGPKMTLRETALNAVKAWLWANLGLQSIGQLTGARLTAYNALMAVLRTRAAAEGLTHVVWRKEVLINISTATYIGFWDGRTPYMTTVLGVFIAPAFMGWPQTDIPL